MAGIDDPQGKELESLAEDAKAEWSPLRITTPLAMIAASALNPIAGAVLDGIKMVLDVRSANSINARLIRVLQDIEARVKVLEAEGRCPDEKEIATQVFQEEVISVALVAALQIQDKERLAMLASGVVNSAMPEWINDNRRSLFFQTLARLNLVHVEQLRSLSSGNEVRDSMVHGKGRDALESQFLEGLGLAASRLEFPRDPMRNTEPLPVEPTIVKIYFISDFGRDFLRFTGDLAVQSTA